MKIGKQLAAVTSLGILLSATGCSGVQNILAREARDSDASQFSDVSARSVRDRETRCEMLAVSTNRLTLPNPRTEIISASLSRDGTSKDGPLEHCDIRGEINRRTSQVDGQSYAIKFRLRLPVSGWNGRFLQLGGGGSNGAAPTALGRMPGGAADGLSRGFAVIATDAGHDNTENFREKAGGIAAFGMDPDARRDHFYNAYDEVARAGKALTGWFYDTPPSTSYFIGCSEGGREAMLMSQRFPHHFDGLIAGSPQFLQPMQSLSSIAGIQTLALQARAQGLVDPDGRPAIHKVFSDGDLALAAGAIRQACDRLDGLEDGLVHNVLACTNSRVAEELDNLSCPGEKTPACLLAGQIDTLIALHAPARNRAGEELYPGFPWDPGITADQAGFRQWWLGDYESERSDATRFRFSPSVLKLVWTTPPEPFAAAEAPDIALTFEYASMSSDPVTNYPASGIYKDAPGVHMINDQTDLSSFEARGGKLILWAGVADPTHSLWQTTRWYEELMETHGADTASFARLFAVPGMAHCAGGPTTDQFDLLEPLMDWVEKDIAPEKIEASASAPVLAEIPPPERPLCPWPAYARFNGSGDPARASSFSCTID